MNDITIFLKSDAGQKILDIIWNNMDANIEQCSISIAKKLFKNIEIHMLYDDIYEALFNNPVRYYLIFSNWNI